VEAMDGISGALSVTFGADCCFWGTGINPPPRAPSPWWDHRAEFDGVGEEV